MVQSTEFGGTSEAVKIGNLCHRHFVGIFYSKTTLYFSLVFNTVYGEDEETPNAINYLVEECVSQGNDKGLMAPLYVNLLAHV